MFVVDIDKYRQKRDVVCPLCEREKQMAMRKKPVDPVPPSPDDVAKMKQEMADGAKAVNDAAGKLTVPMNSASGLEAAWSSVRDGVNQLDQGFNDDLDIRVMQVHPNGRLTDVSDKVNPRELRPEQIQGFDSSDGSVRLPRRANGEIDHDAALSLMGQLLGINRQIRQERQESPRSNAAMQEMEKLLADSDKILKKLRR